MSTSAEDRVRKLDEEIEAQEAAAYGTPPQEEEETTAEPEEAKDADIEESEETEEDADESSTNAVEDSEDDDEDQEDEPEKPKRRSWKNDFLQMEKRFNNYKGSTDGTIHSLRVENTNLREQLTELLASQQQLRAKLQEKPLDTNVDYAQVLTDEQRDYLGDDGIAAVTQIAKTILKQKDDEQKEVLGRLERDRINQEKDRVEQQRQQNFQSFLSKVSSHVPNYLNLAQHKDFSKFGDQPDPINGVPIRQLFKAAEQRGDVRTVVNYLKDFEKLINPSKELDENLSTPQRGGNTNTLPQKPKGPEMLSLIKIEEFYDDLAKGKFKGRESEARDLEAMIDKAEAEGRIINDKKPY